MEVTVIGGVNIDIVGFPYANLIKKDSNPGKVKMSLGGVGRNIAVNLAKLGISTKFISVIGDDLYGKMILDEAKVYSLDMKDSLILDGEKTSVYLAVLDKTGDMHVAIASMDILDKLDVNYIRTKDHLIENTKACVIDTNISQEVINYLVTNHKNTAFFLDTVSTIKAMKVKELIGYFHTIKPNKIEAEVLSRIKINKKEDLDKCADFFLNKGVRRVFISLGEKGLYYNDGINKKYIPAHKISVVNATGAGDAFMAALVYCFCKNYDIDYSARFAMAASVLALSHEDTINPHMSVENIKKIIR